MAEVRLQKFLAQAGLCSRRTGEQWILDGRVTVNGEVVQVLGARVNPDQDTVTVDDRPVTIVSHRVYIALHKPKGVVSSMRHRGEPVVVDLVDVPERIVPIGRLDKESTGLLLLTNDGPLHHRLTHPSFDHEKEYRVTTHKALSNSELQRLRSGVVLDDGPTRPARVRRLDANRFVITLKEGRNRQIRRMAAELGHRVVDLHRTRFAGISLGRLARGRWRHLSDAEIGRLVSKSASGPRKGSRSRRR